MTFIPYQTNILSYWIISFRKWSYFYPLFLLCYVLNVLWNWFQIQLPFIVSPSYVILSLVCLSVCLTNWFSLSQTLSPYFSPSLSLSLSISLFLSLSLTLSFCLSLSLTLYLYLLLSFSPSLSLSLSLSLNLSQSLTHFVCHSLSLSLTHFLSQPLIRPSPPINCISHLIFSFIPLLAITKHASLKSDVSRNQETPLTAAHSPTGGAWDLWISYRCVIQLFGGYIDM